MFQEKPAEDSIETALDAARERETRDATGSPARDKGPHSGSALLMTVEAYGDLIYDLAVTVLGDPVQGQFAFRAVAKKLKRRARKTYDRYERAWALKIIIEHLRNVNRRAAIPRAQRAAAAGEAMTKLPSAQRLEKLPLFLTRLSFDDQILVLLRDKFSVPYEDIAAATDVPVASLKLRREQILRTLEGWIWEI